jgi:hypothetical protein
LNTNSKPIEILVNKIIAAKSVAPAADVSKL